LLLAFLGAPCSRGGSTLLEALYATARVHDLLLTGEERVAGTAGFYADLLKSRSYGKRRATCAVNLCLIMICWVNICFHECQGTTLGAALQGINQPLVFGGKAHHVLSIELQRRLVGIAAAGKVAHGGPKFCRVCPLGGTIVLQEKA